MRERSTDRELRRANFRLIEKELYHFEARKKELGYLRDDVLEGNLPPEVNVQTGPGDMTLAKVLRLQSRALVEMGRRLEAIEYAVGIYQHAPEIEKYTLVKEKYFHQNLTDQGIMLSLSISQNTFYRWRREFITLIADRLGWVV